ncbi:MAG: hypothetical protein J1F42_03205 [Lachnospiraceae bacterium]|nr:hypothetical protein [Lachnospiraceae bacterium]
MSYQMTHLEVAYRLLDKYKWIEARPDFLLGSIAPDAVHFHEEYHRNLKEQSHLWDCGPRWGITLDSDKWKRNVLDFWNMHKTDSNGDYISGYCVHILTDWLNDIKIWSPFRNENMQDEDVDAIYHIYGQEAYRGDQWLFHESNNSEKIMSLLAESREYSIENCVLKKDVETQKKHILSEQYKNNGDYDIGSHRYCTETVITSFIDECVEILTDILVV